MDLLLYHTVIYALSYHGTSPRTSPHTVKISRRVPKRVKLGTTKETDDTATGLFI